MGRKRTVGNIVEKRMVNALDDLADYEEFKESLLPELREALKRGMKAEDITARFAALAAARLATIVAKEPDSTKAMAAAKDILDRSVGKAKERQEVTHKYSKLKDEELDSLLMSSIADTEAPDEDELN
jgi:hypothetical protein